MTLEEKHDAIRSRIIAIMKSQGMKTQDLAEKLDLNAGTLSTLLNHRKNISLDILFEIEDILDTPIFVYDQNYLLPDLPDTDKIKQELERARIIRSTMIRMYLELDDLYKDDMRRIMNEISTR